jgi:hypothetical protein
MLQLNTVSLLQQYQDCFNATSVLMERKRCQHEFLASICGRARIAN